MKVGASGKITSIDIWEIRLISSYLGSQFGVGQTLINEEAFVALSSRIDKLIDSRIQDGLRSYMNGNSNLNITKDLVPFLIRNSFPSSTKLRKSSTDMKWNSLSVICCFEELNLPLTTIIKVSKYLT
ncbi:hypothetical protein CHUAL_009351 [Chamberlinius hualienensis]